MFIAMNNFTVTDGQGAEFERIWRERESYLDGVAGFIRFALLKGDAPNEYISHSTWVSREAFFGWMQSEAFAKGHAQGSLRGVIAGPPVVKLYDAVITQDAKTAV